MHRGFFLVKIFLMIDPDQDKGLNQAMNWRFLLVEICLMINNECVASYNANKRKSLDVAELKWTGNEERTLWSSPQV